MKHDNIFYISDVLKSYKMVELLTHDPSLTDHADQVDERFDTTVYSCIL